MKKIKLFIVLTIILSITLIISGCNKNKFGFKTKEEIINSFTNYEIEFNVIKNDKTNNYLIIEDETFILYQINDGLATLYHKPTKMKYIIKHYAKTKAIYISTEEIDKIVYGIKESFFAAHVNISKDYKKQEDEIINGISCDVYTRVTEGLNQNCYVSKEEGFCVKTYVENNGEITSYEVVSYERGKQSCQEYYEYANVDLSFWPDHRLAILVPELKTGDYESSLFNDEYLEIVYNNVDVESVKGYVSDVQEAKFTENIEEKEEYGYYLFSADNKEYQILIEYFSQKVTIKISELEK